MLNSIAIMVNSTLGAGAYRLPLAIATANVGPSFLSSGNHRYAFWSFCLVLTVLITLSDYPYSRQVLHGGVSLVVFPPSQIKRSVLSLQTQGSALQIRHRNHESLFWVQWARGCFFSERIRWRVSMGHDAMRTNVFFSTLGMCAFGIIIGVSVLYFYVTPKLISAPRGYDSASCFPIFLPYPSSTLCRPSIHHHVHHDLRLLPTTIVPRRPQTLHRVRLHALRDAYHQLVSPILSGDPSKRFSFVKPGILYWGHRLRFRWPPQFVIELWEPEEANS